MRMVTRRGFWMYSKKHKAPAAFFVCKHFIEDQPELVKRMKKEGHVVGNHTANHICMPEK